MMRAIIDRIKHHALRRQFSREEAMHTLKILLGKVAPRYASLIRDDHQREAPALQSRQSRRYILIETQLLWSGGIVSRIDQGSVAVEKERAPPHRDASFLCPLLEKARRFGT